MIYGIGVDIVHIPKFNKAVEKWGDRFKERVFTKSELEYCKNKGFSEQHLAVRFAAKEALFKALGKGMNFTDIEIINNEAGKPELNFKSPISNLKSHITLSHDKDYCIAQVVLEDRNQTPR
ncbi:MAG: holo-ACP synthase [Deltaproteobacteria bacterium]|nr:holo-ACP synthase [Deltaproteobacteria bacterium]